MKKLKLFLMLFVAAVSVCGFTACDDDDVKGASSAIVGTWEYREPGYVDTYTFSANGSFTNTWQDDLDDYSGSDYGTYTYEEPMLILSYEDGDVELYMVKILGDKLTFDGEVYIRK